MAVRARTCATQRRVGACCGLGGWGRRSCGSRGNPRTSGAPLSDSTQNGRVLRALALDAVVYTTVAMSQTASIHVRAGVARIGPVAGSATPKTPGGGRYTLILVIIVVPPYPWASGRVVPHPATCGASVIGVTQHASQRLGVFLRQLHLTERPAAHAVHAMSAHQLNHSVVLVECGAHWLDTDDALGAVHPRKCSALTSDVLVHPGVQSLLRTPPDVKAPAIAQQRVHDVSNSTERRPIRQVRNIACGTPLLRTQKLGVAARPWTSRSRSRPWTRGTAALHGAVG